MNFFFIKKFAKIITVSVLTCSSSTLPKRGNKNQKNYENTTKSLFSGQHKNINLKSSFKLVLVCTKDSSLLLPVLQLSISQSWIEDTLCFGLRKTMCFSPTINAEPTKSQHRQWCFLYSTNTVPDFVTTDLKTAQRVATYECLGQQSGQGAGRGSSEKSTTAG